jgi:hypothetical protein
MKSQNYKRKGTRVLTGPLMFAVIGLFGFGAAQAVAPGPDIPPPGPAETFFLDTHDPRNGTTGVPSSWTLTAGEPYKITVEGTFSIWTPSAWTTYLICDTDFPPEPGAQFPSPSGHGDGDVGQDAKYFFSAIELDGECTLPMPLPSYFPRNFEVCLDGACERTSLSWHDLGLGSDLDPYNPAHVYTYWVHGEDFPIAVRRSDSPIDDNYGQLRVTVQQVPTAQETQDLIEVIEDLSSPAFRAGGLRNALINQFNRLFAEIAEGDYCMAIEIIDRAILPRINDVDPPFDARDWMEDPYREEVFDQTMTLVQTLLLLAGGDCSDQSGDGDM